MESYNEDSGIIKLFCTVVSDSKRASFINTTGMELLEARNSVTDYVFLDKVIPNPFEDTWDLSVLMPGAIRNQKISFCRYPENLKNLAKCYVIFRLLAGIKPSTLKDDVIQLAKALEILATMNRGLYEMELITNKQAQAVVEINPRCSAPLSLFLKFVSLVTDVKLQIDLEQFDRDRAKNWKTIKQFPLIPVKFFKRIMDVTDAVMHDETAPANDRMVACAIRIISQLATRTSEFLTMKTDALTNKYVPGLGNLHYITFMTYKSERGSSSRSVTVRVGKIAHEAFLMLLELRKYSSLAVGTDILFAPVPNTSSKALPVSSAAFKRRYNKFFIRYMKEETEQDWEDIDRITVWGVPGKFSIPAIHSFRVNVCTELMHKKIGLDYIRQHLSHLTTAMTEMYARPAGLTEKDSDYVYNVIRSVTVDGAGLIGANGDDVAESIRTFIRENKIKVTDMPIDELRKRFEGYLFLSPKEGGLCCIKVGSDKTACNSSDHGIGRISCATGTCSNLYRLYYHLPVSLTDFRLARDAVRDAERQGYVAQADMERAKASRARAYALEEITELMKQLASRGDSVLDEHPELIDIVENLDSVKKELEVWK